ncbi:uncharacterized protein LOC105163494 [Sesamum indicum]|uniref:Uncharacterized protein LOC105163494 n=1 Tax=Sesamum indicum TaxID=4182 RepID=A0A6I9T9Q0_SESIN|nr:uncharacterized protein LOC105163494 [Sesamum indicum]
MASMAVMITTTSLSRLRAIRAFQASCRRYYGAMPTSCDEAAKQGRDAAIKGVDAAKKGGHQLKNEAAATAHNAAEKTKGMAEEAAGRVKQSAEAAWGSVKENTRKMSETMAGKADATKHTLKEEAAKLERNFKN